MSVCYIYVCLCVCAGPQAVLEAYGGVMAKLPPFLNDKTLESYTHLKVRECIVFIIIPHNFLI